ncbi:hypothetical protein TEA_014970 [Camellia sinensis var. sinensis]|uniref:Uncharacterized protein n=1 Tax=Camellia sinensis var. sinensis TaxID=542762 RepID=A0A4V6RY97_CAMSN|nr:hypothetical protein TEA_014970 [Camellia sinensis var. sinensis]
MPWHAGQCFSMECWPSQWHGMLANAKAWHDMLAKAAAVVQLVLLCRESPCALGISFRHARKSFSCLEACTACSRAFARGQGQRGGRDESERRRAESHRIPLVRTSFESTVCCPRKAPRGAVPSPSLGRHAATRSRRESSSNSPPTADGFGTGTPVPSPQSQSFSRSYESILPTSLAYIVPSARGCSPWRLDVVMSTTGRGRHSVLWIFKGRRGRTGHRATCGALPAAGPYLWLSRFQVPFTWNLSPLRPSKFSFDYFLLPPSSAPTAAPPGLLLRFRNDCCALLLIGAWSLPRRPGIGHTLKRHPFSGLVDSADERFARQYRCGPPLEFPLASPRSGIVHHLSGPDRHARTRTLLRRSRSVDGATRKGIPSISFFAPREFTHPLTRTHGCIPKQPDSQTAPRGVTGSGHDGALTLSGAPFQGTWARSVAEDASPDYNSNDEVARFSSWAVPSLLAVARVILGHDRPPEMTRTRVRRRDGFSTTTRRDASSVAGDSLWADRARACPGGQHPPASLPSFPFFLRREKGGEGARATQREMPRQTCPQPNGFGRYLHSKTRWFMGFCNSHQVSHFATFFIDARADISVAESHLVFSRDATHEGALFVRVPGHDSRQGLLFRRGSGARRHRRGPGRTPDARGQ